MLHEAASMTNDEAFEDLNGIFQDDEQPAGADAILSAGLHVLARTYQTVVPVAGAGTSYTHGDKIEMKILHGNMMLAAESCYKFVVR